jgi:hypothetical protein
MNGLADLRDGLPATGRRSTQIFVGTLVTVALAWVSLTHPPGHRRPHGPVHADWSRAEKVQAQRLRTIGLTPAVERSARLFLAGYLAFLDGRRGTRSIRDASSELARSLASQPRRATETMRGRRARVLELRAIPPVGRHIEVDALVNGGGLVNYTLRLALEHHGDRLTVTGVDGQ